MPLETRPRFSLICHWKRLWLAAASRIGYTDRATAFPLMKIIVLLFVVFILGSLFSALYFLIRDKGHSERMVKALTVRVVLSITLFVLLMLGFHFGIITTRL